MNTAYTTVYYTIHIQMVSKQKKKKVSSFCETASFHFVGLRTCVRSLSPYPPLFVFPSVHSFVMLRFR